MCLNKLNHALNTHSDICIAATAAGIIPVSEMEKTYMKPPMHPNCGCSLYYYDPDWSMAKTAAKDEYSYMEEAGIDVGKSVNRFNEQGPAEVRDRNAWRERLTWENDVIRKLFG
jgi:hypothetical protein